LSHNKEQLNFQTPLPRGSELGSVNWHCTNAWSEKGKGLTIWRWF
jgi:hypothetical protein